MASGAVAADESPVNTCACDGESLTSTPCRKVVRLCVCEASLADHHRLSRRDSSLQEMGLGTMFESIVVPMTGRKPFWVHNGAFAAVPSSAAAKTVHPLSASAGKDVNLLCLLFDDRGSLPHGCPVHAWLAST